MKEYIQIIFQPVVPALSDILVAALSDAGYEGFEEGEDTLKAYVPASAFEEAALMKIADEYNVRFTRSVIEETNWNAEWESSFQPVIVEEELTGLPWVGIRAHFHAPLPGLKYEIVITPKMSFGTGHHATTYLMLQQMGELDFTGKSVFDFGTGTGVLAILAEKMGAASVLAADYDEWSIENTRENIQFNQCSAIQVLLTDTVSMDGQFDIILANINKNVILEHIPALVTRLKPDGIILFSGLLAADENDIVAATSSAALVLRKKTEKNNWICCRFSR